MLNDMLAVGVAVALLVVIATILGAVELLRKAVAAMAGMAGRRFAVDPPSPSDRVSGTRFRCAGACSFIAGDASGGAPWRTNCSSAACPDRKSTRLNSS